VVNPAGVEGAGATDETVHLIVLREKKLGEIRTVLTGDAGNERFFHNNSLRGAVLIVMRYGVSKIKNFLPHGHYLII
jgi:hypothetical protein